MICIVEVSAIFGGAFAIVDSVGKFGSPYVGMGNNPVMMIDPDGELAWFIPIIIGAVVGGTSQGIASVKAGGSFWGGAWKGLLIGAIAGATGVGATAWASSSAFTASIGASTGFGAIVAGGAASGFVSGGSFASLNYSETAFESFDRLSATVDHEMFHRANMLSGKYDGVKGKLPPDLAGLEEYGAYMRNYQNQGLYPKNNYPFIKRLESTGLLGGVFEPSNLFQVKWWHFLYRIPRRY